MNKNTQNNTTTNTTQKEGTTMKNNTTTLTKKQEKTLKHFQMAFAERRTDVLKIKDTSIDFSKIDERFVEQLRAYYNAQKCMGAIDIQMEEYAENFATANATILEKEESLRTESEKASLAAAQSALDAFTEKCKEDKKPFKTIQSKAVNNIIKGIKVTRKDGTFVNMHDGYCQWVMEGKKGVMKDCMLRLFKNMGVASDKTNLGDAIVNKTIEKAFEAVGMQLVSNKTHCEKSSAQYKPWSAGTFNRKMMSAIIDLCVENGVEI